MKTYLDYRVGLLRKGFTLSGVAVHLKTSRQLVRYALNAGVKRGRSLEIKKEIEKIISGRS